MHSLLSPQGEDVRHSIVPVPVRDSQAPASYAAVTAEAETRRVWIISFFAIIIVEKGFVVVILLWDD